MKSVLISIQPKWVEKIANGEKTIEVRKTRQKIETPFKCYIYMSQGDLKDLGSYSEWIYKNRMRVVGEFICDKVYNLVNAFGGIMFADENLNQLEPQLFRDMSCLTDEQTADYLCDKDGYGLHITDLKIYNKPKELSEFNRPCPIENKDCENCIRYGKPHTWNFDEKKGTIYCTRRLTRPPQSWQYVEELENGQKTAD